MRLLLWCFCLLAASYETINHYHYLIAVARRVVGSILALDGLGRRSIVAATLGSLTFFLGGPSPLNLKFRILPK